MRSKQIKHSNDHIKLGKGGGAPWYPPLVRCVIEEHGIALYFRYHIEEILYSSISGETYCLARKSKHRSLESHAEGRKR